MLHRKTLSLIASIFAAVLLFSGCRDNTTVILPPDSTSEPSQTTLTTEPTCSIVPTTQAQTHPTENSTEPTISDTAPTDPVTPPSVPPPSQPHNPTPKPTKPAETTPKETEPPATEPAPTVPTPTEPPQTAPTPTDPAPTEPTETTPAPTNPAPTEPTETTPAPTDPAPTEPTETTPAPTEPAPTEPMETEPAPTQHLHSFTTETVSPTCTQGGYTRYICGCGVCHTGDRTDPLGHDYTVTTVSPTANKRGYDLHQCTRCSHSFKDNYTDIPSDDAPTEHCHSYEKTVTEPTCTTQGYTQYTCSCGKAYQDEVVDALGHDYQVTTVPPTTQQQGYDLHECRRCGNKYIDSLTDTLPAPTEPPQTEPAETEPPQTEPPVTEPPQAEPSETEPPETEAPTTEPSQTEPSVTTSPVYDISDHVVGSLEYEILEELNARRSAEGVPLLNMDKKLCALAAIRAYESSISFSHTRPDGSSWSTVLSDYQYGCSLSAENLLYYTPGYAVSQIVDVWMRSSAHKNNILNPNFTVAGLGIYEYNGYIFVASLFAG